MTPSREAIQEQLAPLYQDQGRHLHAVLASRSDDELRTISDFLADAAAGTERVGESENLPGA